MQKKKWNPLYFRMCLMFLSAGLSAVLLFVTDNQRSLPRNEKGAFLVERNRHGKGMRTENYNVSIGGVEEEITLNIEEQKYTEQELRQIFGKSQELLEKIILGENESLEYVTKDLNLVTQIPETGISVFWEADDYEVINPQGKLNPEKLEDTGTLVKLKALLVYGQEKAEYTFYVHLYPVQLNGREAQLQKLSDEIQRLDDETREDRQMTLPSLIEGVPVTWKYVPRYRAAAVLLLGAAAALFLYTADRQKKKKQEKKREQKLMAEYPQLVSRLTLFLGAGMTAKNAWRRIAGEYNSCMEERAKNVLYEEMTRTMHEMQDGISESECYERFGERCALSIYRKFGALLSQNLKKGTKGLAILLKQEAEAAFEERKCLAKRLGEEAGTKMLVPMFLMLAVVLIIIVIPAFFTIQI